MAQVAKFAQLIVAYWHNMAWWHETFTWTYVDFSLVMFCSIHLRAIS